MNTDLRSPQRAASVVEWLRAQLSGSARRRVRALTDPLAGPLGSIRAVRTTAPLLSLTFDDGPDPVHTPGVLDVLAAHGARATWFVLVDRAEANPQLVRRMLAEGHDVGLHGVDHRRLTRLHRSQLRSHIRDGARRLAALTGEQPKFFRPPYGAQSLSSFLAVRREGMESIVWSADCDDWSKHPEEAIARRALDSATRGAVLLLHDTLASDPLLPTVDPNLDRRTLVKLIVEGLWEKGLRSVALSELLGGGEAHRTLWFRA